MAILDKYVKPSDKKYSENRIDWIIGYWRFLSSSCINYTVFSQIHYYGMYFEIKYIVSLVITWVLVVGKLLLSNY